MLNRAKNTPEDIEIVESLLREPNRAGVGLTSAAESKAAVQKWERTLASLRGQARSDRAAARRAIERVREEIASSPTARHLERPAGWRESFFGGSRSGAWAVAASFFFVVAGAFWIESRPATRPLIDANQRPAVAARPASLAALPSADLGREIASVGNGGDLELKTGSFSEAIRISKPMRISAAGGAVRIGASN